MEGAALAAGTDPNDPDSERVAVTGLRSKVGITKTPGFVIDGDTEYLYTSGSDGSDDEKCPVGTICKDDGNLTNKRGRQSWREVQ